MQIIKTVDDLRAHRRALSGDVAFVPTMGALHEGHLSLIRHATTLASHVITSIFVNPTQFGPNEDLNAYPRDLERDAQMCQSAGCSIVFAPSVEQMYPSDEATAVHVRGMTNTLCGPHRPGHFEGVTTIVTKLFNAVAPDVAVFGQKDYQQLAILKRMTTDLMMPIRVEGVPTVREPSGLAMSSRNRYLTDPQDRTRATHLARALTAGWAAWQQGQRARQGLLDAAQTAFEQGTWSIDYLDVVNPDTLHAQERFEHGAVMALAVRVGSTRLIDNIRLDEPLPALLHQYL